MAAFRRSSARSPIDAASRPSHEHLFQSQRLHRRFVGLVALFVLLLLPASSHAAASGAGVAALEGWRYRWGDSPAGSDGIFAWAKETGDTEAWRHVEALQSPPGRDGKNIVWLSIPLPAGDWVEPGLFLGEVASAVEVYANGQRIYTSGKLDPKGHEVSENLAWHLLPLPRSALGTRVLLRIQSSKPAIGVSQDVRVGSRHDLLAEATRQGQAPFVMSILLLTVGVAAAGSFLLHSRRRMLAGLAIFATSGGLVLNALSGLPATLWGLAATSTLGMNLGIFCLQAGLMEFISDAILDKRLQWYQRATMGLSIVSALCAFITLVDMGTGQQLLGIFLPLSLLLIVGNVFITSREAWRGNPDARLFVFGLVTLALSLIITLLPVIGAVTWSLGNVTHWGYLALTLSLVSIVARRSMEVVRSLETHTRQLEARQQEVRQLAERMQNGAGELATVVQQLRSSSDEQAAGVSRQAVALNQANQTVQEIRRTSQLTAEKASMLAASAESAEQVGREGAAAVESTVADLADIRAEVSEMARRILALDARTREVSGIVDDVKDLADQSNMLAINAAIEAARSGDSGKGFGVVAREMRSLADQSIQATHRIRAVLDSVSKSMREAARSSEQGDERVQQSLDAVRTSGAQLQKLAEIIADTSASMRQITAAVSAQDEGTRQMAEAIKELSGQMHRTLKTVQETQDVTKSVQSLAASMSGMANQTLKMEKGDAVTPPAAPGGPAVSASA